MVPATKPASLFICYRSANDWTLSGQLGKFPSSNAQCVAFFPPRPPAARASHNAARASPRPTPADAGKIAVRARLRKSTNLPTYPGRKPLQNANIKIRRLAGFPPSLIGPETEPIAGPGRELKHSAAESLSRQRCRARTFASCKFASCPAGPPENRCLERTGFQVAKLATWIGRSPRR